MRKAGRRALGAAAIVAIAGLLALPAAAQEVTPGEWQYSTTVAMPPGAMPNIPPEQLAKLPPAVRARIDRMMHGRAMDYSVCVTSRRPTPHLPKNLHCKIDHMSHAGDKLSWSASCTMRNGQVSSAEAVATYRPEHMEMDMTIHSEGPDGAPITMHQHITGHYVGPCKGGGSAGQE